MKFSKTTGCFYPDDIQYQNLPADLIAVTDGDYSAAMVRPAGATLDVQGGKLVIVPAPTPTAAQIQEQTIASCVTSAQARLDALAKLWGYDSILSAASYANSTTARFKAESLALIAWRDAVWLFAYQLLDDINSGIKSAPSSAGEFLSLLPEAPERPSV